MDDRVDEVVPKEQAVSTATRNILKNILKQRHKGLTPIRGHNGPNKNRSLGNNKGDEIGQDEIDLTLIIAATRPKIMTQMIGATTHHRCSLNFHL